LKSIDYKPSSFRSFRLIRFRVSLRHQYMPTASQFQGAASQSAMFIPPYLCDAPASIRPGNSWLTATRQIMARKMHCTTP